MSNLRVLRGGSRFLSSDYTRVSSRLGYLPDSRLVNWGFRVVKKTSQSNLRVLRGGSFYDSPVGLRSARRVGFEPWFRYFNRGFRCVRTSEKPK